MADRPRLKMIDDPLALPRAEPPRVAAEQTAAVTEPASPAHEPDDGEEAASRQEVRPRPARAPSKPLRGVFGRVPADLARRLEGTVFELKAERARVAQQDVLAALLWRYVDHTDATSVQAMHDLLDEYEAAREADTVGD